MAAVVAVVLHKYDVPPLAVNVVLCPLHIVLVPDIDAVGKVLTVAITAVLVGLLQVPTLHSA